MSTHNPAGRQATKWLTGNGVPSNSLGIPGDFYYDLEYNVIYYKDGNTWVVQLDFNDQIPDKVRYKVNFSTNATEAPYPSWGDLTFPNEENKPYYLIPEGHHFFAAGYDLPVPTRTGYTLTGGIHMQFIILTLLGLQTLSLSITR